MKKCNACGNEKPLTEFYKRQTRCRPCDNRRRVANLHAAPYAPRVDAVRMPDGSIALVRR